MWQLQAIRHSWQLEADVVSCSLKAASNRFLTQREQRLRNCLSNRCRSVFPPKSLCKFSVLIPLLSCIAQRHYPIWGDVGVKLNQATPSTATPSFSLTQAVILLVVVFAIAFPAFAYYGHQAHGQAGVSAAVVAAIVCLGAGLVAISFLAVFRHPQQAFHGVGLAMLFRMAIPMGVGFSLSKLGGPLAEAGVFGMIVGFYLVGLLVETLLAVRLASGFREEQVSKAA
jgi:hypothetical protein